MYQKNKQLPESIVIEAERLKADDALRKALREANDAYYALRQEKDLGDIPEPHRCTTEWLEEIMTAKKKAVNDADHLTIAQKNSQVAHWGKFAKRILNSIKVIQCFISSIPREQYVYDDSLGSFYLKNISGLVTSRCTRKVPVEAQRHWQLILKAKNAIHELREWEKEKDLKKFRLEELFNMTPEQISTQWATENIRIDHTFDHLPRIVINREINKRDYL